jgi:hypothetical protein
MWGMLFNYCGAAFAPTEFMSTTGWGFGGWGVSPWGGAVPTPSTPILAGTDLQIILKSPGAGEQNVLPSRVITVAFYSTVSSINVATTVIKVNGVTALSGVTFLNGFNGHTKLFNGVFTVQIMTPVGWDYDSTYRVYAYVENLINEYVDAEWAWSTIANPICYPGLTPIPLEVVLQEPLQRLLPAEYLRSILLSSVLRLRGKAIKNAEAKAARVVYQTACASELSTLLNQYVERDTVALGSVVCEQDNTLAVDRALAPYTDIIKQAILALENKGFITREYINTFHDYLNSANYNLRVSLVCNLVIISKLFELKSLA